MILDSTGRKLRKGQIVRVPVTGMLTGVIEEIYESAIVLPGEQGTVPPRVRIALFPMDEPVMQHPSDGDKGIMRDVYIVQDAQPGKVEDDSDRRSKLEVVQ